MMSFFCFGVATEPDRGQFSLVAVFSAIHGDVGRYSNAVYVPLECMISIIP